MQLPTHLITAVLIDKGFSKIGLPTPLKTVCVASACYLSHGILDKIAQATYHPPDPLDNRFWKTYHHRVLPVLTRLVLVIYGPNHALAMAFSALPDLDWVVRGKTDGYRRKFLFWNRPVLNESLHDLFDKIPVINQLNRLPNMRLDPKGVLVEMGLVTLIFALIQLLDRRKNW